MFCTQSYMVWNDMVWVWHGALPSKLAAFDVGDDFFIYMYVCMYIEFQ